MYCRLLAFSLAFLSVTSVAGYPSGPPVGEFYGLCNSMTPAYSVYAGHINRETNQPYEAQDNENIPYKIVLSNTCYKESSILQGK